MKVNINISAPTLFGEFAKVDLSYIDTNGASRTVRIDYSFEELYDFSKETQSVAFDFFLISTIIYGIDNLLERYLYSIDGWARDIEVTLPVNNLAVWNTQADKLETILSFLTGDYWKISFKPSPVRVYYKPRNNRRPSNTPNYNGKNFSFASLISGGLDSLIGVIDKLHTIGRNEMGLLISHFDPTSPGTSADQERLIAVLGGQHAFPNKFAWLQGKISLSNRDANGVKIYKESSYRSRSLLFIGIGIYIVEKMPNSSELIIPENGTISLNYPLTPSRTSSLSTRTTHPYYINELKTLLAAIGLSSSITNPYVYKTKGEMVSNCLNSAVFDISYQQSVSCGKRGRKQHWDTRAGTHHCGVCMPCIYRRAALHTLNKDTQLYGIDIFTTRKQILSIADMPALFDFLNLNLKLEDIKRGLILNGSIDLKEIDHYANVVFRVIAEIKTWISDKGDLSLKKLAGL